MTEDYEFRFGGIARLYGQTALDRFRSSHVAIIGIGGVGSWASEALARSGLGAITLFDLDDICVSNVNRQIHAVQSTVGQQKVDVMAARLQGINPTLNVKLHRKFVSEDNLEELIAPEFDYVFDATDSVKTKTALIAYCVRNKIKLITSGGAGGQTDPSKIAIADLSRSIQDPLLAKVRNNLRQFHGFTRNPKRKFGVECVFSTEPLLYDQGDGSVCQTKPTAIGPTKLDCASGFGAVTHLTASFGFMAVSRILKKLASNS